MDSLLIFTERVKTYEGFSFFFERNSASHPSLFASAIRVFRSMPRTIAEKWQTDDCKGMIANEWCRALRHNISRKQVQTTRILEAKIRALNEICKLFRRLYWSRKKICASRVTTKRTRKGIIFCSNSLLHAFSYTASPDHRDLRQKKRMASRFVYLLRVATRDEPNATRTHKRKNQIKRKLETKAKHWPRELPAPP